LGTVPILRPLTFEALMRTFSILAAGLVCGSVLFAGCDKSDSGTVTTRTDNGSNTAMNAGMAEERDMAMVRVVNAMPGRSVDIYANDSTAFGNVGFRTVTDWKAMPANTFDFKVALPGGSPEAALGDNHEKLGEGEHYTIIAMADEGGPDRANLRVLQDDLHPVSADKARVRVIHAVAGAPEVDVFITGRDDAIFSGINFRNEAGWKDIDPASGTLEIRPQGKSTVLARIPGANLQAGSSYTYVVTGTPAKMQVIPFVDVVEATPDSM
jgi:hypothetical protein